MKTMVRFSVLFAALATAFLIFGSCGHDEAGPTVDIARRDTPLGLTRVYSKALEERSLEAYHYCLDPGYSYVFLEDDYVVAGVDPGSPYWGKTEDMEAAMNMLSSSEVTSISCDLAIQGDVTYSDTSAVFVCDIDLQLTVLHVPDPTTYLVGNSLLNFTLCRDPYDGSLWVVREIREELKDGMLDFTAAGSAFTTEPSTLGALKARFKQ